MAEVIPSEGAVLRGYFLRSSSGLMLGNMKIKEVSYEDALREIGNALFDSGEYSVYSTITANPNGKKYTTIELRARHDAIRFEYETHGR